MATFLGMRGTGDWVTGQRPENWGEMIMRLFPNGKAPLTAILQMSKKKMTDDPKFHWWGKTLDRHGGAVTDIFVDATLNTQYTFAGHDGTYNVDGGVIYAQMAEAVADMFKRGHTVMFRHDGYANWEGRGLVLNVVKNGANSYIAVRLLEDTGGDATNGLETADIALIVGNSQPEGSEPPDAIAKDPEEFFNYTQIFRDTLDLTGTALETRLRTGPAYQEARRDCLEEHSIAMEMAFLFGERNEFTGSNGEFQRTTRGILSWAKNEGTVDDFTNNTDYSADLWGSSDSHDWLIEQLELMFRYGSEKRLCLCGSGALIGLNKLAETLGHMNISPATKEYGLDLRNWVTPVGTIKLLTHPLLSAESAHRNMAFILDMDNIQYAPMKNRDTKFRKGIAANGYYDLDGRKEGFLTEAGLLVKHPSTLGVLYGIGQDNVV